MDVAVRTFILNRDYYSRQADIYQWLVKNVKNPKNLKIRNLFGYIHYDFDDVEDYTLFVLTWGHLTNDD